MKTSYQTQKHSSTGQENDLLHSSQRLPACATLLHSLIKSPSLPLLLSALHSAPLFPKFLSLIVIRLHSCLRYFLSPLSIVFSIPILLSVSSALVSSPAFPRSFRKLLYNNPPKSPRAALYYFYTSPFLARSETMRQFRASELAADRPCARALVDRVKGAAAAARKKGALISAAAAARALPPR